ncbi:MAG: archaemetzincin family Zn-dependent metalloprotease [Gemmatimonadota bacterium]
MKGEILLAFLNDFQPGWSEELRRRVGKVTGHFVRLDSFAVDLHRFHAPEREQYHATLLLAELLKRRPASADHIVGITEVDLYIPVLTFVFGQAQLGGPGAVISVMRLHPQYYGLPSDEDLLLDRAVKEVVHELGHGFGLVHCPDYSCVMSSSTYVEGVDLKQDGFCSDCLDLLTTLPGWREAAI